MTPGDVNVVSNLRYQLKEAVAIYTDKQLADAWRNFSQSEDYPEMEKFIDWIEPTEDQGEDVLGLKPE